MRSNYNFSREDYFWTGHHKIYRSWLAPYMSPYRYMQWIPPKSMRLDPKKIFDGSTNREYMDKITSHGTVHMNQGHIKFAWDKDKQTLTIDPGDHRVATDNLWAARWISDYITALGRRMPCQHMFGNSIHTDFHSYIAPDWPRRKTVIIEVEDHMTMQPHSYHTTKYVYRFPLISKVTIDLATPGNNAWMQEKYDQIMWAYNESRQRGINRFVDRIMKTRTSYDIMDLSGFGGISIATDNNTRSLQFPARMIQPGGFFDSTIDDDNYVLAISPKHKYNVQEEGFDGHGSHIWKIVSYMMDTLHVPNTPVVSVFLIGKEYTGQWWMHYLPPFYANARIPSCERWILQANRDDVLISEA